MGNSDDRIESRDLLVIKKVDPQAATGDQRYGKQGWTIRIVQWIFNGKGKSAGTVRGSVSLEKRETYMSEDGRILNGKAKGFTTEDLGLIQERWEEIVSTMSNPPAPAWSKKAAEPARATTAPTEDIENTPF